MMFFSIELLGGGDVTKTTVQRVLLQMLVWLFFVGFLSYRIIIGIASGDMSNAVLLITGGALLISIFILIYNSWFRSFVLKIGSQLRGEAVRDAGRLIAAQRGKRPK